MMRQYRNQDKELIIKMIDSIYQEYGDSIYLQDADSDLLDIEANYLNNGKFWVTTGADDTQIIGCIAIKAGEDNNIAWLKRFYLLPEFRGLGIAQEMHESAIQWCQKNDISEIHLWSDTRFKRAHLFYQKNGYQQTAIRDMNDGAMPYQEYHFVKLLR
jgi:putative acetyltransferase